MKTEGIKYIGSKKLLLDSILELAQTVDYETVWDAFSGTTRVSQAFAQIGKKVICSDISEWSRVFGTCYLKCTKERNDYKDLINHLNNIKPNVGWFTENYAQEELKCPFQKHNLQKLDGIREEIDNLKLGEIDKSVALTSLMLALDKVDNTLGHYSSYLKNWSRRSYKNLELIVPNLFNHSEEHQVIKDDVFNIVDKIKCDLVYLDPPYGSANEKMPPSRVRYSGYYHLLTTICLNDKPKLFGKARRREDSRDLVSYSLFEDFRKDGEQFIAIKAIIDLITRTDTKYIILSYYNQSKETLEQLTRDLAENWKHLETKFINHKKNVMSNLTSTNQWIKENINNQEILFLMRK